MGMMWDWVQANAAGLGVMVALVSSIGGAFAYLMPRRDKLKVRLFKFEQRLEKKLERRLDEFKVQFFATNKKPDPAPVSSAAGQPMPTSIPSPSVPVAAAKPASAVKKAEMAKKAPATEERSATSMTGTLFAVAGLALALGVVIYLVSKPDKPKKVDETTPHAAKGGRTEDTKKITNGGEPNGGEEKTDGRT